MQSSCLCSGVLAGPRNPLAPPRSPRRTAGTWHWLAFPSTPKATRPDCQDLPTPPRLTLAVRPGRSATADGKTNQDRERVVKTRYGRRAISVRLAQAKQGLRRPFGASSARTCESPGRTCGGTFDMEGGESGQGRGRTADLPIRFSVGRSYQLSYLAAVPVQMHDLTD